MNDTKRWGAGYTPTEFEYILLLQLGASRLTNRECWRVGVYPYIRLLSLGEYITSL